MAASPAAISAGDPLTPDAVPAEAVPPVGAIDRDWLLAQPVGVDLGGTGSRPLSHDRAFTFPIADLDPADRRDFFFGNRVFNTNWVQAPASVASFDGLGPVFNRVSCSGCHLRDGRGRSPEAFGGPMLSMLIRLSLPGTSPEGGPNPHPAYGDQLNDRALPGVPAEGRAVIHYEEVPGAFADGEPYSLRRPRYEIADLAFGPLGDDVMVSPRVAPAVIGLGLLEAVPEALILALADPDDADGDGISGRPNRVWDAIAGRPALGRFGWKANVPSLRQQNAGAAIGDIGLTSALFPEDNCPPVQVACRGLASHDGPELSDSFLDRLTLYTQVLAVPARRHAGDPAVRRGETLFRSAGCAACHMPTLVTGPHPVAALSGQIIHPFTDLLLHDLGEDLADGRPDFQADGQEWRTPPLWGLGLLRTVNGHTELLHDGRARSVAEAILWHGGEAEPARAAFTAMNRADRAALLAFLNSL